MEQSTDTTTTTTTLLSNGDIHNNDTNNLLSEYEIKRAKNIERNNARLVELGLLSVYESKVSNASAWKKENKRHQKTISAELTSSASSSSSFSDDDDENIFVSSKNKKKRVFQETITNSDNETTSQLVGTRKSLRLQGITVTSSTESSDIDINKIDIQLQREQRRRECQEVRQRIALEYATTNAGSTKKNTNPSATYEHCLYRIRTMSHKALENRINIIERAAGKHSIIKMAITASCLQDAQMWDLATLATAALERLKALVPPPELPLSSTVSTST